MPPKTSTGPSTARPGSISASAARPMGKSAEAATAPATASAVASDGHEPPRRSMARELAPGETERAEGRPVFGSSPVARPRAVPRTASPKTRTTAARASRALASRSMASPTGPILDRSSEPEGLTRIRLPPAGLLHGGDGRVDVVCRHDTGRAHAVAGGPLAVLLPERRLEHDAALVGFEDRARLGLGAAGQVQRGPDDRPDVEVDDLGGVGRLAVADAVEVVEAKRARSMWSPDLDAAPSGQPIVDRGLARIEGQSAVPIRTRFTR